MSFLRKGRGATSLFVPCVAMAGCGGDGKLVNADDAAVALDAAAPSDGAAGPDGTAPPPDAPISKCNAVPLPVASGTCPVIIDFTTATAGPINASNVVMLPQNDGRNGKLTHQDTDGTAGGVVDDYSIVAVSGPELPPGIVQGVHFAEHGFTTWGADYSLSFTGGCYDISATGYDGIAFYAKASAPLSILVGIHTNRTTAAFDCGGTDVCWGFYRATLALSTTWAPYTIKFSELVQPTWAMPQVPFDPTKVVAIIWATAAGGDADWTVTDVRFTGHDDTSGCVMRSP